MGVCQLKNTISYTWLYGLVMSRDKSMCTAILNAWDCLALVLVTLYFLHWNKHWFNLFFGVSLAGAISHLFLMVFVPESPKWLLAQGRVEDAISSFNKIGKFN